MIGFIISILGILSCSISSTKLLLPAELADFLCSKSFKFGSFATYWNLYLTNITLILYVLDLLHRYFFKEKNTPLNKTLRISLGIALPFSFIVTLTYWPTIYMDYTFFYPAEIVKKGIRMPLFLDLSLHLFPLIFLSVIKRKVHFLISSFNVFNLVILGFLYSSVLFYAFYFYNEWPYPIMYKLGTFKNFLGVFLIEIIAIVFYLVVKSRDVKEIRKKKIFQLKKKNL